MGLVSNVMDVLRSDNDITPRELSQRLGIQLEMAIDILKEIRQA